MSKSRIWRRLVFPDEFAPKKPVTVRSDVCSKQRQDLKFSSEILVNTGSSTLNVRLPAERSEKVAGRCPSGLLPGWPD